MGGEKMVCKGCGADISENTKFCGKCGAMNESDSISDSNESYGACPNCGTQIPDGARFCQKCGTNKNMMFKCEDCGFAVAGDAEFCPNCGAQFETEKTIQEEKLDKGRRRSVVFCVFSAIFIVFTFLIAHSSGKTAEDLQFKVMMSAGVAMILGVIALVEAYRTKNKVSAFVYVCIIISFIFLLSWGIKGDEIEAERLAEYYSSDAYEAKQMLDNIDKMINH